jgi:putative CocE/NonD family hydrolase
MKKSLLLFLHLSLAFASAAQNSLDSAWIRDNYYKIERMVPMRDGTRLFTSIYVPKDTTERHPFLMTRTPYSCAPYGEANFRPFWNGYQRLYLRENYIIVTQDVRGRYMSEGEFTDVRPHNPSKKGKETDEASDTYDTIDWLLANVPHNNGRVGVFGISYPGFYTTMAALSGHPALKAASPQAPVTDWFMGDDFHHNGAFFLLDGFNFYTRFGLPRPKPTTRYQGGYEIKTEDNYDFYLRNGALKNFARLMGDSISFWKELYEHPNYDDWWKARNPRNHVADIKPAILTVGGLFDAEDVYGAWRLYEAIEKKNPSTQFNKIVMGPWFHGQWGGRSDGRSLGNIAFGSRTSEWYQNQVEVPFFNHFLKGKGDLSSLPEATVFMTGQNEWRTYDRWPPAGKTDVSFYLGPQGTLGRDRPGANGGFSSYTSDPARPVPYTEDVHTGRTREYMTDDQRFASRRPDVLTFSTPVLTEDLTVTGTVIAELFATLSTTDADFVVKVIDVFPDDYKGGLERPTPYPMGGYQMLVRGEVMRGRFRNSFEKPEAFKPGKAEKVRFELPDVSHTFKKGHRLMVQVQSTWFPLVDRNPQQFVDIYKCDDKDFVKCDIRIHHDAGRPSAVILPVLGR